MFLTIIAARRMNKTLRIILLIGYNLLALLFCFATAFVCFAVNFENTLYEVSYSQINESLNNGNYKDAMLYAGSYYNSDYIYFEEFDDGKIVIFESAVVIPEEIIEDGESKTINVFHKAYSGFLFGFDAYEVNSTENNQTKIVAYDKDGKASNIDLLDIDTNDDGVNDTIYAYKLKRFIYFEICESKIKDIDNFSFIDKYGNVFVNVNFDKNFSEQFFTDVDAFITEYNLDSNSNKLQGLYEEFMNKSDKYLMSSTKDINSDIIKACLKDCIIVFVIFLILALIGGDFIFGFKFSVRIVKWIIRKVFKKGKDEVVKEEEIFGNDFYSQVTIKLDISDVPNFELPVGVFYSNEKESLEYNLLKINDYSETKRVKAGVYVNPRIELSSDYIASNMPANLKVNSYKSTIIIKINNK